MNSVATVEKIEKNYILVSTVNKVACGEWCATCNSCTAQKNYTKAVCDFNVSVGDIVVIESNTLFVIFAMLLVFIVPLILPLTFYALFSIFGDLLSVVGIFVGIILSCLLIFYFSRSRAFLSKIVPKITSIKNKK